MVTLKKSDLGRGPRFLVADPGVRYRGPLRSPILTVQALCISRVKRSHKVGISYESLYEIRFKLCSLARSKQNLNLNFSFQIPN